MKKLITLLLVFSISFIGYANDFPKSGKTLDFQFNGNTKDELDQFLFKWFLDDTRTTEYAKDSKANENGAVRIRPHCGFDLGTKLPTSSSEYSIIYRFKCPNNLQYLDISNEDSPIGGVRLEPNGKITYTAKSKLNDDEHKAYTLDFGLKTNEWITLVLQFDKKKSTASISANGITYTIKDFITNQPDYESNSSSFFGFENESEDKGPVLLDELTMYDRNLSQSELLSLCGNNGKIINKKPELIKPHYEANLALIIIQIIVSIILAYFIWNNNKKRLNNKQSKYVGSYKISEGEDKDEYATRHLMDAFSVWRPNNVNDLPQERDDIIDNYIIGGNKKNIEDSLNHYEAALSVDSQDTKVVKALQVYRDCYNSLHKRIYNCQFWFITIGIVAVYVHSLLPSYSFGLLQDHNINFPAGWYNRFFYVTQYHLVNIVFGIVALYIASFAPRYKVKKDEKFSKSDFKNHSYRENIFIPLLGVVVGLIPGFGIIPTIITVIGYFVIAKAGSFLKTDHYVYKDTGGDAGSEINYGSLGTVGIFIAAAAVAIYLIYAVSSIVIFAFNLLFIYMIFRNFVFSK